MTYQHRAEQLKFIWTNGKTWTARNLLLAFFRVFVYPIHGFCLFNGCFSYFISFLHFPCIAMRECSVATVFSIHAVYVYSMLLYNQTEKKLNKMNMRREKKKLVLYVIKIVSLCILFYLCFLRAFGCVCARDHLIFISLFVARLSICVFFFFSNCSIGYFACFSHIPIESPLMF